MADAPYAPLLNALNIVVMERLGDRSFRVAGILPDWFAPLNAAMSRGDSAELERDFPFLDHFLEDAAAFWREPPGGVLKSGPCSMSDGAGGEFFFEISTGLIDRRIFLIFQRLADFDKTRTVLQRVRERTLDLEHVSRRLGEIRGPLQQLSRTTQALGATPLSDQQKGLVDQLARAGANVERAIDEIAGRGKAGKAGA